MQLYFWPTALNPVSFLIHSKRFRISDLYCLNANAFFANLNELNLISSYFPALQVVAFMPVHSDGLCFSPYVLFDSTIAVCF